MSLLLIVPQNRAFIYMSTVLRTWDKEANCYRWFIGLGDYHCKGHPATVQHRQELEQLLAQADPITCKLVVEDLSSKNDQGRHTCGYFVANSRGGLLGGLAELGQSYGMATENLEYRYARVCALAPVLNQPHADPGQFASVQRITVGHMYDEVMSELKRLAQYDDGDFLNRWYAERIASLKKRLASLGWQRMARRSTADLVRAVPQHMRTDKVAELLTFDGSLFDMKLVHATVTSSQPCVVAIAGGSHIKRVVTVLQQCGYELVDAQASGDGRSGVADAIEGGCDSRFADQPPPIVLQWLQCYIRPLLKL
jgi:hypothetical protein